MDPEEVKNEEVVETPEVMGDEPTLPGEDGPVEVAEETPALETEA